MKELTGKFYDIQGFSVHDGPGIRLTLFMKGCPLRCPWCHSPESIAFATEINFLDVKCEGIEKCGRCLAACPKDHYPGKRSLLTGDAEIRLITVTAVNVTTAASVPRACLTGALSLRH